MTALPDLLAEWCAGAVGSPVVGQLFDRQQASSVYAVELADERRIVIKSRRDADRRAAACVQTQKALAAAGFACAAPVTDVHLMNGQAVHAEEFLPGGDIDDRACTSAAEASATAYAQVLGRLAEPIGQSAPPTNPDWVRWSEGELFPRLWWQEEWAAGAPLPPVVCDTAGRVRNRLADNAFAPVLGHADWETQNLRWSAGRLYAVHDWDSLASLPECALVGAAAGTFASNGAPTLAPLDSSAAFLDRYQQARGRTFCRDEVECAWAASLWAACYNARTQILYDRPHPALDELEVQARDRLTLADA